ncbi:carboxylic ester hydrolase [Subtercola lobariae]|uniref:Carboxylic ester hydrolase n=1 Tax=Subtercola lobariae TaxID=1588641 RepID=A0A917EWN9_9MICO|nr:carboxylesterase family protein [Subtercola lobariae]GGF22638.1 carboxylic ester hydrolase [Subtercola lobariae]
MVQVQIEQGLIRGNRVGDGAEFLGIPYAAAPVGELRWREPHPPSGWEGARDATAFGAAALQTGGASFDLRVEEQSEDSLFVNVWTNSLDVDARQPVMVWLHGGGNLGGAGSEDAFDGRVLAQRGVTVVTLNYRLGAFGFLAHPSVGANFAVLDQVAALRWVKTNIRAFGGDPNCVTIFGESAGAWAVRTLLSTPTARGLFHRAIIQSAGYEDYAFQPAPTVERAYDAAERFFDLLGARDLDRLRALPASDVLQASHALNGTTPVAGRVHTPANLTWSPVADGVVVSQQGFAGWADDVPVLLGRVANEARYFIRPGGRYDWAVVENMAAAFAGDRRAEAMAVLHDSTDDPYAALDVLFTTAVWTEPALATLNRFVQLGRTVFPYRFTRVSPGAKASGDLAKHTAEIRYVFGNLEPAEAYDEVDAQLSRDMQEAWSTFARTGAPEVRGREWPRYRQGEAEVTVLGDQVGFESLVVEPLTAIIASQRRS